MTALSDEQAAQFESLLREYEQMREDAQNGLKDVVGDLRAKLALLVAKEDVAAEVAGFREAVKRRWIEDKHPEKAAKIEAKTDVADAYEHQLSNAGIYTTRTRSAGRAKLDTAETEIQPFDADIGEITDTPISQPSEITGQLDTSSCGPVLLEDQKGTATGVGGRADKHAVSSQPATFEEPPICQGAPRSAAAGKANTQPLAGDSPQETRTETAAPAPMRSTVDGRILTPDTDRKHVPTFQPEGLEIPDFLRRAQPQGSA